MSRLRTLARGFRSLFCQAGTERDLNEELRTFMDMAKEDKIRSGMDAAAAARAVRLERGSVQAAAEEVRSSHWEWIVEACWQDLRFAGRMLRKDTAFTAAAMLTLALGIGASTSTFSIVDAVLLHPLPYPNPQRIVRIWEQSPKRHLMNLADPNFDDFRARNATFTSMAAYDFGLTAVSGGSEPVRVNVAEVTRDFFTILGVSPLYGRGFAPEEQRLHGSPAVIVSYRYWQRYLGGARDLGQFHLTMDGLVRGVYPVIGVMPAGVDFPPDVAAWIPRELGPEIQDRTGHNARGIGRLRDGATVAQAGANLRTIARQIKAQYGSRADLDNAVVVPLLDAMVGDVRTALLMLFAAVGLLMLVACVNVAGLLLARSSARARELAIRSALGAGRGRLIQQFLLESLVLSGAGGVLGLLLAASAIRSFPSVLPVSLPRQQGIAMSDAVLIFAVAATVFVAASLGLFAAWRASSGDLQSELSSGSRGSAGPSTRLRGSLVVTEIAATLVMLIAAGVLGRSFLRLVSTSPGFPVENLITAEFPVPTPSWQAAMNPDVIARQIRFTDALLARIRRIPGAESVGLAGAIPVAQGDNLADGDFVILNGRQPPTDFTEWRQLVRNRADAGHATYAIADESYFRAVGIPVVRGRTFDPNDDRNSPNVAVISQALARERWPDRDPIGEVIDYGNMDGNMRPLTIVGVVGDVRGRGLDLPPSPIVYVDYRQRGMNPNSSPTIFIRGAAPAGEMVPAAGAVFRELAPEVPVKFSTLADEMHGWLSERRFVLLLVGSFAAFALLLASVGIYGIVAYSVARRTREIGIRMSLGARRSDVMLMVIREGARLTFYGVTAGIIAAIALIRLMSSLLFDMTPTDPLTYTAAAMLLSLVAGLASFMPARRAARVDPTIALQYE